MKKLNNIIIIGCSIPSLYAGIRLLDMGYKVSIIEKKNSCSPISQAAYHNFSLYNDTHKSYINLLKRYDIEGTKLNNIKYDTRLFGLINNIIQKAKLIPNNILITHTFTSLCKYLISDTDLNELNSYENIFSGIFNIVNAADCINFFSVDMNSRTNFYFVDNDCVNDLITKMIKNFQSKTGKLIYNNEVKNIKYIKKKYIITTNMHHVLSSDLLLTSISRNNLMCFGFWNNDQKILLNSVSAINSSVVDNMLRKLIFTSSDVGLQDQDHLKIRNKLLNELHIVYPLFTNKSKYIYIWNNCVNNVLVRERIKDMYNDKFIICSESFSKNNMFINYSLEYIDSALVKLYKYT
jgi:hypothetical protein